MILRRKHQYFGVSFVVSSVLAWNDFADVEVFVGRCPLVCSNGSVCRQGNATTSALTNRFPWLVGSRSATHFCQCRDGYTGSDCSVAYEACHEDVGDGSNRGLQSRATPIIAVCLHGGHCGSDGSACDCSSAVSSNGTRFVGRNCEVPMPREFNCSEGQPCLNGGNCLTDNRCDCPAGFQGVQCETADPEPLSECTLPCQNNGVCVREFMPDRNGSTGVVAMALGDVPSIDGLRCDCPDGYQGVLCQYQVEVCGRGEHLCLHGSHCVQEDDNDAGSGGTTSGSYRCECDDAEDRACAKPVEWCRPSSRNYPSHPDFFESSAAPAFCVNGGRCRDTQWGDYLQFGCECPALFHGPHCELVKNGIDILTDLRAADARGAGTNDLRHYGFVSLSIFLAAMVLTTFVVWGRSRWRVRRGSWGSLWRRRRPTAEQYNQNLYSFRDENGGGGAVTTANGNLFFPTSYGGSHHQRHDNNDDNDDDDELLVLHDVEIM